MMIERLLSIPHEFTLMGVLQATGGALLISSTTLLVSLYAIYSIYTDVTSIWTELDYEIGVWKVRIVHSFALHK